MDRIIKEKKIYIDTLDGATFTWERKLDDVIYWLNMAKVGGAEDFKLYATNYSIEIVATKPITKVEALQEEIDNLKTAIGWKELEIKKLKENKIL